MLSHSPSIVTEGLSLYYDMNNTKKSFKGKPTTNLYGSFGTSISMRPNTLYDWNGTGWGSTGINHSGPDVNVGGVWKFVSGALNATWSGNSYGYMYKDIATTNGVQYTGSFYCYVSFDCNITALPISTEITGGYSSVNLSSEYDMNKKGTWQRISITTTGVGTTSRFLAYPRREGIVDGSFTGYFLICGSVAEIGNFATPYVSGTRTDTQSLIDLTNNFTLTTTSLTYSADNKFSFNGGADRIVTNATINNPGTTWEAWINCTQSMNNYDMFMGSWLPYFSVRENRLYFSNMVGGSQQTIQTAPILTFNTWVYASFTTFPSGGNTLASIYMNGELITSAVQTGLQSAPDSVFTIGDGNATVWYPFKGSVSNVKVYNRTLSAAEIRRNFNATRSRYGL